jgi:hypothetical protein
VSNLPTYYKKMPSIKAIYDDPRTSSKNPATLAKRAGVTTAAAAAFLKDQTSHQATRRAHKPADEDFAPTGGPRGEYLADVVKLSEYRGVNKAQECILTLLGVNSRYVYARGLTRATAAKTAEALTDILEQNKRDARAGVVAPISAIRSDGGPEFDNATFVDLLKRRKIKHEIIQPNTHARLARLDRYHGTLRRQIGATFIARNSHVWVDVLQDLVDNHNESPSRALDPIGRGTSPAEVGPDEEDSMRMFDLTRAAALRERVDALNIRIGTQVRLLASAMKNARKFRKAQEATWTAETYSVIARAGVNSFRIDTPAGETTIWPAHALQVVHKALGGATKAGPKVDRAVVAAKRMEALNISEEEQASALAAPATKKRAIKPTAKAAALAADARPKRAAKAPKKLQD